MYITPVTVTTSATRLAFGTDQGGGAYRNKFVHLYNEGPVTVYVSYDGTPDTDLTSSNGIPLEVGEKLFLDNDGGGGHPFGEAVWGITASGTSTVRAQGIDA